MRRIECAVLCDAASIREGLLNLLSAGITRVELSRFPAPLPVTFAMRVVLEPRELRDEHILRLELQDDREQSQSRLEVVFNVKRPTREEEVALVAPVSLDELFVPRPGLYLIKANLDDGVLGTFPLKIEAASRVSASS